LQVLWSGPGNIQDSLTLNPTVFQAGQYFIEVVDQVNGCLAQDSLWVVQDTVPPVALATALGVFDCETAAVVMSGAGSSVGPLFVYTWTGPPGAPISDAGALSPTVFEPGWYVLTVQNEQNGCISLDSAQAVSEGFPILGVELELTLPSCYGDQDGMIRIDSVSGGQGPFLYAFEDNGFYPFTQFRYLAAGTYAIVVEDDNGCRYDTLIYLDNPNELAVDLGPDLYIQLGEWATIEAIANVPSSELELVQWYPSGDPECPECLVFDARPSFTTTFQILIRNERGCVASDEMTVFVDKETPVYFPNVFSPNGDGENDRFFVQSGSQVALVELLQIFDRWGNLVFEAREFQPNDPNFGWDGRFNDRLMNSQVFVWQCQIQLRDGSIETHFGDVLLAH
jgi:gliding motility-associated-like protein